MKRREFASFLLPSQLPPRALNFLSPGSACLISFLPDSPGLARFYFDYQTFLPASAPLGILTPALSSSASRKLPAPITPGFPPPPVPLYHLLTKEFTDCGDPPPSTPRTCRDQMRQFRIMTVILFTLVLNINTIQILRDMDCCYETRLYKPTNKIMQIL